MTTQWVSSVAEFVSDTGCDVAEGAVADVKLVLADGRQVAVTPQGRDMVQFMLRSLCAGHVVHVDAEDDLLSPDRAAELLGVTRPTVYRWQDAMLLPRVMKGRVRAVPTEAVMRLKTLRDSRADADRLAAQARDQRPENAVTRDELFTAAQAAARAGRPAQAAGPWRARRASAVAEAAQAAREALAGTADA